MLSDFSILIGGKAGQGTRAAARILGQMFNHLGWSVYIYEDYQSLIRGGHNFSEIRVSQKELFARKSKINFLLALDQNTVLLHKERLEKNGILLYNADAFEQKPGLGFKIESWVRELGGKEIMANTALVCAFAKVLGIDWKTIEKVLKEEIHHHLEMNLKIGRFAFEKGKTLFSVKKISNKKNVLLTGNEAVALGLKAAGLDFYFAYPMTPSTSIMNFLARKKEWQIKVIQPENEIAVLNMALGAAFAGKRAAVGTSGGGFALMVETLSLAGQAEVPVLIVESQRGGPSTGMPTYNLQGDLNFVISAGHGDFPRLVFAPSCAKECYLLAALGLNLAWKFQVPAILLLDKDVSENTFPVSESFLSQKLKEIEPKTWSGKEPYARYRITPDGISPLAFPGQKATIKANSYEHDEMGITADDEKTVKAMQEKRKRKQETIKKEIKRLKAVEVFGKKNSKVALVSFGISAGAAKEVAENLNLKLIQPLVLEPFPTEQFQKALSQTKKVFTAELNSSGQLAKLLNQQGIKVDGKILKYTGRPFFPEEIEKELKRKI